MTFQPGNQLWKARSSHGRNPTFAHPDDLEQAVTQYFEWVEDNPLIERKVFANAEPQDVPKIRAMTISGLRLFLDVAESTFDDYRKKPDFRGVIRWAEDTIYNQKLSGAAADLLNANIISRELGLKDAKDHTSSDGSMSPSGFNDFYDEQEEEEDTLPDPK